MSQNQRHRTDRPGDGQHFGLFRRHLESRGAADLRDRALGDVIEVLVDREDAHVLEDRLAVRAIGTSALD